jgi:hypothetical protein
MWWEYTTNGDGTSDTQRTTHLLGPLAAAVAVFGCAPEQG